MLTGTGDVLEPEAGVMGIGSGGNYALAAARAPAHSTDRRRGDRALALTSPADICVYTNRNIHRGEAARDTVGVVPGRTRGIDPGER